MYVLHKSVESVWTLFTHLLYLIKHKGNMFAFLVVVYNLNISPSYNSFKSFLGNKWPYMNVVYDVKTTTPFIKNKQCILFSSYSYLNNHANTEVQQYAIQHAIDYSTGNHGPRMLMGNMSITMQLEKALASFFYKDACIVSSTGYMACCSVMSVLCDKHTIIFADSHCHASLVSGFKLSGSNVVYFKHNCTRSLELWLNWYKFSKSKKVVVTESIFSMDGTICNLPEIKNLCVRHKSLLVVDEAHGLGTLGTNGRGIQEHYNMPNSVDIIVGTFSKSLSNLGGFICASNEFIRNCEYYSHANVFTAGLSAYHVAGAFKALTSINRFQVTQLQNNATYLRQRLVNDGFNVGGHIHSPIIPVIFTYDVFKVIDIAHKMHSEGYAICPILPPACSVYEPRFRITATTAHSRDQIDRFVYRLKFNTQHYRSKLNHDTLYLLRLYKRCKRYKHLYRYFLLTVWTRLLGVYPCFKTVFMKHMTTLFNLYNFFINVKIF